MSKNVRSSKASISTDELCGRLRREQRLFDHETPMQLEFHMWVRSAIRRLEEPHTPADARQVFEEWLVYRAPFVRPLKERLLPWRWGKNLAPVPAELRLVDTGGVHQPLYRAACRLIELADPDLGGLYDEDAEAIAAAIRSMRTDVVVPGHLGQVFTIAAAIAAEAGRSEDVDAALQQVAADRRAAEPAWTVSGISAAVAPALERAREAAQAAIDGGMVVSTVSRRDRVLAMTDEERSRAGLFIFAPSQYLAAHDADES